MALETRRATAVALNAEIRRSKARLLEDIPKLHRLAFKKVYTCTRPFTTTATDLRVHGINRWSICRSRAFQRKNSRPEVNWLLHSERGLKQFLMDPQLQLNKLVVSQLRARMLDLYIIQLQVISGTYWCEWLVLNLLYSCLFLSYNCFDTMSDGKFDSNYFQHTEDTNTFRQEYEMRKMKQVMWFIFCVMYFIWHSYLLWCSWFH